MKRRFRKYYSGIIGICFFLFGLKALAQCPVASSCTPGNAPSSAYLFGMGIYNVTVGSGASGFSNPTAAGVTDGYQDYSCIKKATVLEGVSTSISISTNISANENVRVWIDLNNNGILETASELVFSSNNAKTHSGTFTIPVSASVVKNTVLRMRVSADNFSSPVPTPCSTPAYSQVEDYGITVLPNTNKPAVDFTVNKPITCSPTVQFTNLVQNGATSYLWNFGDGTTSTAANPSHTYAATGTYPVKLKACNANGCDSLTKTNYVTYHTNVPVAANCTPTTTSYCCGYGITKVTFHTMVNTSQDGSVGYEDFTCTKSVSVQENATYPISITSGTTNPQDLWVYIDYNNDGNFTSTELTFTKLSTINPAGNLVIKSGGILNTRLRMRVIADAVGNSSSACSNRSNGQAEDYTIIISLNTSKPVIDFTSNKTSACDTLVQFTDLSQNAPTSWLWDFGDGTVKSTLKTPFHTYTKSGIYEVKLKACNGNGCDSLTKTNFIIVNKACLNYCIPINTNISTWITNVTFANLNNTTGREQTSYGDYTNLVASVVKGNTYPINISLSANSNSSVAAFIDYNQDGDFFDKGELVVNASMSSPFSRNIEIPVTVKTGLTRMRVMYQGLFNYPCLTNASQIEVEDYSIEIRPNNLPPTAQFFTTGTKSCSLTISFTDTSANTPTSWLWDFGDPASGNNNFSYLASPTHKYSKPGSYTISLKACNAYGCNTVTKNAYVVINSNDGPRSTNCLQKSKYVNTYQGITRVKFGTIDNTSLFNDNYQDYSCSKHAIFSPNDTIPITIEMLQGEFGNVRVWIDYNNDGTFDPITETAFSSDRKTVHLGKIIFPVTAIRNKFLRMRIAEDLPDVYPPTPCNQLIYGQAEDYAVKIYDPSIPEEPDVIDSVQVQELNIYPNPSNGTFSLELPTIFKDEIQLEAQDLVGKIVAKQVLKVTEGKVQQVDLSKLAKGIYMLKIFNSEVSAFKKIIIE